MGNQHKPTEAEKKKGRMIPESPRITVTPATATLPRMRTRRTKKQKTKKRTEHNPSSS